MVTVAQRVQSGGRCCGRGEVVGCLSPGPAAASSGGRACSPRSGEGGGWVIVDDGGGWVGGTDDDGFGERGGDGVAVIDWGERTGERDGDRDCGDAGGESVG